LLMHPPYTIDVQDARVALQDRDFVAAWDQLVAQQPYATRLFASPDWVSHLDQKREGAVRVWRIHDQSGELVGVVPIQLGTFSLRFSAFERVFLCKRLSTAQILGSTPNLPADPDIFRELMEGIFADWPDCESVYGDAVSTDSGFWQLLNSDMNRLSGYRSYIVNGPRPWHTLEMPPSFDDYMMGMNAKSRSNLRRSVRRFKEFADGRLELSRCTTQQDVESFLRGAVEVSRQTWQHRVLGTRIRDDPHEIEVFKDLASRGLLRCYLLNVGDKPCAFVVGYQHYGVFCYDEVGFDEGLAQYSPGKVLLFLIVEDLHAENRPDVLNFGVGDATYKRRFGTSVSSDASCLLLPRTARNGALLWSHSLFTRAVRFAKKVIRRRVTK